MKFKSVFLLCAVAYCAHLATAEQESKYNEIIKLLSDSDQQLKPAAQTYSASVADPNDYPSRDQGYSRSSERTRYAPSSKNDEDDDAKKTAEDEEDKKPDRLAILLADSKFACDSHKNGYYADESVGCQVFHYCVDGVKHSWQCPENTVFHQIHLNCVPNTQDICGESSKFHVVNDYLHKELNERGPNNTILYHQRYYPEGFDFSGGDTVTQIFQAQAQAALQKAKEKQDGTYRDYDEEEAQPPARPRPQSRPKSYGYNAPSTQPARSQASKPAYKPVSRPVAIPVTYPPTTKRPVSYTTPEAFTPPSYTESTQDDYSSNDYSPSSGSSSSSSSSSSSPSFSSSSIGSNYNSGNSASSYSPSSPPSSSFSSSSHSSHSQPTNSFRPSSSSRGNYPTRSLGIPIASFRVAPSTGYSSAAASASTINEVNVPLVPTAFNQQVRGYYF